MKTDIDKNGLDKSKFDQVIIGGLQRSGTSLVRALVGSHPEVSIYQWDLQIFEFIYPKYGTNELTKEKAANLVHEILDNRKVTLCDITFEKDFFLNWIDEQITAIFFSDIYMLFFQYYLERTGRRYVGLKTPFNEFFSDEIFDLFPQTKFIHVVRNPLDAGTSLKVARKNWWGKEIDYKQHIDEWKKSAQLAITNRNKFKDQYFVLKYEELLSDPVTMAKRICDFLDIRYDKKMVQLNGQPGWKGHNSSFATSDSSVFKTSSIGRYKSTMDKQVQMQYFYHLKELLQRYDYDFPQHKYLNNRPLYMVLITPYRLKKYLIRLISPLAILVKRIGSKIYRMTQKYGITTTK